MKTLNIQVSNIENGIRLINSFSTDLVAQSI